MDVRGFKKAIAEFQKNVLHALQVKFAGDEAINEQAEKVSLELDKLVEHLPK